MMSAASDFFSGLFGGVDKNVNKVLPTGSKVNTNSYIDSTRGVGATVVTLPPQVAVNESIQTVKGGNPDDNAGAVPGGGQSGLSLAPLGLRGSGGVARTPLLGA